MSASAIREHRSPMLPAVTIPDVPQPPPLSGAPSGAWQKAARIPVAFDARTRKVSAHPAVAYAERSGDTLYVAWIVPQKARITAEQRQNDAGFANDDSVIVYLYPGGPNGFVYAFMSNPIGTHSAFSSENTSFAPTWQTRGSATADGYAVYMKIPLDVMKGGRSGTWRANFRRYVSSTLDDYDWSYNAQTVAGNDPPAVAAGTIAGLPMTNGALRPRPRIGMYALGEAAAPTVGGPTSRIGLDASVPITATTTFVSTIHPDYSNVEIDQATISPTAFPRYFSDVRPFFTQLQNYYNTFACFSCTGIVPLYTTSIPTPRYGNAIEGKQGPFGFAAFDADGVGRDDNAQVVNFTSQNQKLALSA
ncbi:MAG TPA: hypothetical protein VFN49_12220 [Candidatus Aquilonibacter sp.]|nr:hypothetical protein [Candidatus Aquilonibacter sp.]